MASTRVKFPATYATFMNWLTILGIGKKKKASATAASHTPQGSHKVKGMLQRQTITTHALKIGSALSLSLSLSATFNIIVPFIDQETSRNLVNYIIHIVQTCMTCILSQDCAFFGVEHPT